MECQNCAFNQVVQAVSAILMTYTVVIRQKNIPLNPIEYLIHRRRKTDEKKKKAEQKVTKVAEELLPKFNKLKEYVASELLPLCQNICMTCSRVSNDDNLSRCGQNFVFMEAMPGAAGELAGGVSDGNCGESGEDGDGSDTASGQQQDEEMAFFEDDEDEVVETRGNWLNENALKTGNGKDVAGVSKLPIGVEDTLKNILSSFRGLTIFQQVILLLRWQEMSFVDIGSMTWVPSEFTRHNDKQLVGFWWRQIVKKFPWADALSAKKRKKGETRKAGEDDDFKSHSPKECYVAQELDFGVVL